MNPDANDTDTIDAFLGGRLNLRQPKQGLRAGSDAVFLAAAVPARSGETALELGSGIGAAALCLARRVADLQVTGLEIQPDLVAYASANAMANDLADRVEFIEADLHRPPAGMAGRFDHVFANPPFFAAGNTGSPDATRRLGRTETAPGDLPRWIAAMLGFARPQGSLTLIYRIERQAELLAALGSAAQAIVLPLLAGRDKPAKRVLVQAWKGRSGAVLHPPGLVLHGADGRYTAEAETVLREGAGLSLDP